MHMRVMSMPWSPWHLDDQVKAEQSEEEKEYREYGLWGGPAPMETVFSDVISPLCVAENWSSRGSGHAACGGPEVAREIDSGVDQASEEEQGEFPHNPGRMRY